MAILNEESVTVAQAAKQLGVSQQTVWRWIEQGRLPAYRVGQKRVRIRKADLERVITPVAHREKSTEVTPIEGLTLGPLTPAERRRWLLAIQQARRLQADMLVERHGKLFGPSYEVLDELRNERIQNLS